MADIEIRYSRKEDYEQLVALENLTWNNQNTPQVTRYHSIEDYMEKYPVGTHLVAVTKGSGQVLGMVEAEPPTTLFAHRKTWMIGICVHPQAQGTGIAMTLMSAVKQEAAKKGIHKLSLHVLGTNPRALQFYFKNGFELEGTLKDEFEIEGEYVDDLVMSFLIQGE